MCSTMARQTVSLHDMFCAHVSVIHTCYRENTAPLTDQRVKVINEVVASMKVIKMYGWELMFKEMVGKVVNP